MITLLPFLWPSFIYPSNTVSSHPTVDYKHQKVDIWIIIVLHMHKYLTHKDLMKFWCAFFCF